MILLLYSSFMIGERKLSISYVTAYRILTVAEQAERCTRHLGVIFKIDMGHQNRQGSLPLSSAVMFATLSREERIL